MDEIFKQLNPNNTVTINRPLAHALGTSEAIIYSALIAKQAYYEQREMLDEDGYFFCTISDLQESTGLTRYQQDSAIKNLTEVNLIECHKKGIPARRFFRVNDNVDPLQALLQKGKKLCNRSIRLRGKTENKFVGNLQTCLRKTHKLVWGKLTNIHIILIINLKL